MINYYIIDDSSDNDNYIIDISDADSQCCQEFLP